MGEEEVPAFEFPAAKESLNAVRRAIGPSVKGSIKIIRRFVVGAPLWRVESRLNQPSGPDYELDVEGDSLDEVAFALVDAIDQVGFTISAE